MKAKAIPLLFLLSALLILPLTFALQEVAKYEGSLDVGADSGVIVIGPGEEQESLCGNSIINKGEQCDLQNLNSQTCSSLLGSTYTGSLSCKFNCIYDTSQCTLISNNNGNNGGSSGGGGGGGGGSTTFIPINTSKKIKADIGCIEDWDCSEWSACINGGQVRTCSDKKNCGTTLSKPVIERFCENKAAFESNNEPTSLVSKLLGAVVGLGGSTNTKIIASLGFLVIILVVLIVINAPKKDMPTPKVNEAISVGKNNKVLNSDKKTK